MIGTGPPEGAAPPVATFRQEYLGRILEGDLAGAETVVARARLAGARSADVFKGIIAPALADVGRMWARAELSVADEHMATEITATVVSRVLTPAPARESRLAVVACGPREPHGLGARAFSVLLGERGWRVAYLGPRTPSIDLEAFIAARRPELVAFSIKLPRDVQALADLILRLKTGPRAPKVLVGGSGAAVASTRAVGLAADRVEDDVEAAMAWVSAAFGDAP